MSYLAIHEFKKKNLSHPFAHCYTIFQHLSGGAYDQLRLDLFIAAVLQVLERYNIFFGSYSQLVD